MFSYWKKKARDLEKYLQISYPTEGYIQNIWNLSKLSKKIHKPILKISKRTEQTHHKGDVWW